jgi:hypothetical protein
MTFQANGRDFDIGFDWGPAFVYIFKRFSVKVNKTVAPSARSEFCTGESVFSYCITVKFGFKAAFGFMGFYFYGCLFALLYDHCLTVGLYALTSRES